MARLKGSEMTMRERGERGKKEGTGPLGEREGGRERGREGGGQAWHSLLFSRVPKGPSSSFLRSFVPSSVAAAKSCSDSWGRTQRATMKACTVGYQGPEYSSNWYDQVYSYGSNAQWLCGEKDLYVSLH